MADNAHTRLSRVPVNHKRVLLHNTMTHTRKSEQDHEQEQESATALLPTAHRHSMISFYNNNHDETTLSIAIDGETLPMCTSTRNSRLAPCRISAFQINVPRISKTKFGVASRLIFRVERTGKSESSKCLKQKL